ncbi:MAG: hypothetical protein EXR21_02060 [Flavobacteriaceae bacterium]|nr:hypothetical protein [Flavobacteriaceae bacterium]
MRKIRKDNGEKRGQGYNQDAPIHAIFRFVKELVNCEAEHNVDSTGNHIAEVHSTIHIARF